MTSRIDLCGEGAARLLPAGAAGKWQSSSEEAAPLQSILTCKEAGEKPPDPHQQGARWHCHENHQRASFHAEMGLFFLSVWCY